MKRFEVLFYKTELALARAAASAWLEKLRSAAQTGRPQTIALSGGRIARPFFTQTVTLAREARAPHLGAQVHFFWADERCVPPDHPESNFCLANRLLIEPLGVLPASVHRVRGEADPTQAAIEASAELTQIAPSNEAGQPVLDLVFLGMGEDGHVASLFPGVEVPVSAATSEPAYHPVLAPKPPPQRITLGYGSLLAATEVWVLISGAGKERALQSSITEGGSTPLARVLQNRSHTRILTTVPLARSGPAA